MCFEVLTVSYMVVQVWPIPLSSVVVLAAVGARIQLRFGVIQEWHCRTRSSAITRYKSDECAYKTPMSSPRGMLSLSSQVRIKRGGDSTIETLTHFGNVCTVYSRQCKRQVYAKRPFAQVHKWLASDILSCATP